MSGAPWVENQPRANSFDRGRIDSGKLRNEQSLLETLAWMFMLID
jgi:hypothetical protein